jgi:serine/threonine protein kinase
VFDPQRLLSFAEDIVLGMIYLHGRSIFHCDLKSSNVLLDRSWNLKLCDFGLSRLKGKKCLGRIGTVNWMAP